MKVLVAAVLLAAAATFAFWPAGSVEQSQLESPVRTALASAVESADQPDAHRRLLDASTSSATAANPADEPFDPTPVLVPPWTADVFVFDQDDRPAADAVVTLWTLRKAPPTMFTKKNYTYSDREEPQHAIVRTDATGHACLVLDRETYEIEASKENVGCSNGARLWHEHSAASTTRLELLAPLFVQGRVLRVDGGPAADAEVTVEAYASPALLGVQARAVSPVHTDAEGRFRVPVQRLVSYRFMASQLGKQTSREELSVRGSSLPEITLTFPGAITVSGLVVDVGGRPVPGAEVTAWRDVGPWDPVHGVSDSETVTAKTSDDGRFAIEVRRHARYQLLASASGHATSDLVQVETNAVRPHAEARLALTNFATIRGRVLRGDGSPFPGIMVTAAPESGLCLSPFIPAKGPVPSQADLFPRVHAATAADDGSFVLTVHPATTWTLSVRLALENRRLSVKVPGVAPGRDDVMLTVSQRDLAGCVVSGTVIAADGAPAVFTISIVDFDPNGRPVSSSKADARWEGNRFECVPLPLGQQFALRVHEGDRGAARSRLAEAFHGPFRTDQARLDVNIRLEAWGELAGRVLHADGSPARRVMVGCRAEGPLDLQIGSAFVDAEGRFKTLRCAPGANRISVCRDGAVLHAQEVTILPGPNPEIVIRLPAK